jgi:hypothetical protein
MDVSAILNQCFGTETIYSSFSPDFEKVSVLVPVSIPGPDPNPDLDFKLKNVYEILAFFNVTVTVEAALLSRKLLSHFFM